jgi:hypothetical protein
MKEAKEKVKNKKKLKKGPKQQKTTAKAAGATGAAGATYIVGEGMSPSQTGPVNHNKKQRESQRPS